MKRIGILALFAALIFGSALSVNAQPPYPQAGPDAEWGKPLTPEQREKARKIFDDSYASMDATRQALIVKRAELDALLASPNPDKAKIESLSREIGALRGKMLSERVDVRDRLSKEGLSDDYYGPGPHRGYWDNGPDVWHGGRHHGYDRSRGGWSCPGMRNWQ